MDVKNGGCQDRESIVPILCCLGIIPVFVLLMVSFSTTVCGTSRQARQDYTWVPFEAVTGRPSNDQKEILSTFGIPHAVWQKPFGIFEWVYCLDGSPTRVFDFDENGVLLGQGIGGRRDLCRKGGANGPEFASEQNGDSPQLDRFASLMERARHCFRQRHVPDMAKEALLRAEQALRITPSDFEASLLVTRTISYIASSMKPNQKRKWLAYRGYKIGKKLVKHYSKRVEGYYFAGINLGLYAECMGTAAAVRENVKTKIGNLLDQAIRLDRDFMQGAPLIAKARYLFMLPWPMRDREWAVKIMTEVKRKFPQNPSVDLFFADLAVENGEKDKARELLEAMIRKLPDEAEDYADGVTIRRQAIERLKALNKYRQLDGINGKKKKKIKDENISPAKLGGLF